jgi:hypothetical protein
MNLARWIIVLSVLGCLVLGVFGWRRSQELADLRDAYESRIQPLARDLMQSAQRHTQLSKALKDDNLAEQKDLETYIRRVGIKDKVEIGNVDLTNSTEQRTKGVVDKIYRIRSDNRERSFQRLRIANFLFMLEYESRRVKVTDMKIEVAAKQRPKPHEVPEDLWTFDAEVTVRQRAD